MSIAALSLSRFKKRLVYFSCLLLFGGVFMGCGSSEAPELGEWTLQEDALTLTEDLRVSETEAFFFGSVSALDVTSDGRIVVADGQANNIKVLRPDGSLIDTLGGPGEGPGEFQALRVVRVARGDSLYAHDLRRSRLTVFAPNAPYDVERMVRFPRDQGGFVGRVYVLDEHFVGTFGGTGFQPEDGIMKPAPSAVRRLGQRGTPGDTLLLAEPGRIAVDMEGEGGIEAFEAVPFDRQTVLAEGSEARLYHGWTDSLHFEALSPEGESEVVASIPTNPKPVTAADRDSALSDVDDGLRSTVASAIPESKPAFTDLVVAEDGRLWVQRPAESPETETVPWWVLDPEAQTIQTTRLPENVDLKSVKGGQAYGMTTTDVGAPAVVRYAISSET